MSKVAKSQALRIQREVFTTVFDLLVAHQRAFFGKKAFTPSTLEHFRPLPLCVHSRDLELMVIDGADGVEDIGAADPQVGVGRLRELRGLLHLSKERLMLNLAAKVMGFFLDPAILLSKKFLPCLVQHHLS